MQCSQFMFVCIYIIAWVQFLWSRPQTTSHMILGRPEGDRHVKKIVRESKWSRSSPSVTVLESEGGKTCFSSSATMTPPQQNLMASSETVFMLQYVYS